MTNINTRRLRGTQVLCLHIAPNTTTFSGNEMGGAEISCLHLIQLSFICAKSL